jgi:hypothetical protein
MIWIYGASVNPSKRRWRSSCIFKPRFDGPSNGMASSASLPGWPLLPVRSSPKAVIHGSFDLEGLN